MLLRSIPPKLDSQHEKARHAFGEGMSWVLLTFRTYTQFIYSVQSHSRLTQPPVLPSTSPPATILSSHPQDDIHCQVCQSLFDEHKMLLFDSCNAGCHMDCLLSPLTAIRGPHGTWKCPLCTLRHLLPQTVTRHLRLPFLVSTLIKIKKQYDSLSQNRASGLSTTIYQNDMYLRTLPPEFWPHTHMHAYHEGSGYKTQV